MRSSGGRLISLLTARPTGRVESTEPYPGLRPVDLDKTIATPPPEHVLAAADALVKKRSRAKPQLNKWLVSVYRTLGFAILTVIVLGLVTYIGTSIFYLVSTSWVTPAVISPTDEHVLGLASKLAEQSSQRDKLAGDRALLVANLADVDRIIAMDEKFAERFRRAVNADIADRRAELQKLRSLAGEFLGARGEINRSNRAFAGHSRLRNEQLKQAGLIDEDGYLSGNYQVSQMASANLQLAERAVDLDAKTTILAREAEALSATLDTGDGALSYDALRVRQEYERARLELEKARDTRTAFVESLAAADRSIERYDRIVKSIQGSPLLAAAEGKVTVVMVPYENLGTVKPGGGLYACALGFFACHRVGKIVTVMPGEMEVRDPHNGKPMRGQAVQVELSDASAAGESVLFARKPLFL
jgi:hypothetical protein